MGPKGPTGNMVYLFAFSAGGLQLLSRSSSDVAPMRENLNTLLGPLYACNLFMENHGAKLVSLESENHEISWKTFYDSVMLVLVIKQQGSFNISSSRWLDAIFHGIVMALGSRVLDHPPPDVLKRAFSHQLSQPFIEFLLGPLYTSWFFEGVETVPVPNDLGNTLNIPL